MDPPTRRVAVATACLLVASLLASGAVAGPTPPATPTPFPEDPNLSAFATERVVEPGADVTLAVQLLNDAEDPDERVQTARNVRARMRDGGTDVTVRTGTLLVGNLTDGQARTVEFRIHVPRDVEPGTHRLPIRLRYEVDGIVRTETASVRIRVRDRARFEVDAADTTASIGESGRITLSVRNTGSDVARNATVAVRSPDPDLVVGDGTGTGTGSAERFVGRWAPDERKRVVVGARVAAGAIRRSYPLAIAVTYRDADGERRTETLVTGVRPGAEQRFSVVDASANASVGGTGTLVLAVRNEGPDAVNASTVTTTAAGADVAFGRNATLSVTHTGRWTAGEVRRIASRITVAETALRRNHSVRATVEYEDREGRERSSRTLRAAFRPDPEQTFAVVAASTNASVGDTGTLVLAVRNEGPDALPESTVTASSSDAGLGVGPGGRASVSRTGRWAVGEVKRVATRVTVAETALRRNLTVRATVDYEDEAGVSQPPRTLETSVRPLPEQSFALRDVEADLRVGEEGRLVARVENTGARVATDVVVALRTEGPNATTRTVERPVGTLAPGESAPVDLDVAIPRTASAGPRRLPAEVRYETAGDDAVRTDRVATTVDVGPWRPAFAVTPVNATFQVDSEGVLVLRVTRTRSSRVRDLTATLATSDPLASDDPSAFVAALDPDESARAAFHLDVSDDAVPSDHPVAVELTYTDEDGRTRTAGPYAVGVRVTEQPGTGLPVLPAAAALLAIAVAAVWWWHRRE